MVSAKEVSEILIPHQIELKGKSVFADGEVEDMVPDKSSISGEVKEPHEIDVDGPREILVRSVARGPSLVVPAVLYGHYVNAVVDSAAQVTVISEEQYQSLGVKHKVWEVVRLRGAAKEGTMEAKLIRGVAMVIGERSFRLDMYIAPITDPFILGLDFLLQHECKVDFHRCTIEIGGDVVSAALIRNGQETFQVAKVTLVKKVVVPPNTIRFAVCAATMEADQEYVVTSVGEHCGLLIPAMLVQGREKLVCSVLNPTDRFLHLKAGHFIGNAVPSDTVITEWSDVTVSGKDQGECLKESSDVEAPLVRRVHQSQERMEVPEQLRDLLERTEPGLEHEDFLRLQDLLIEYEDVFSKGDFDLGCFTETKHRIDTGDAKPIKQRMRRTPLGFQEEEEKHLQNLLNIGVITASSSEWAAAPVFVRKKDGGVRYCLDFRAINDVTTKDAYPLPLIEECIDTLSGNVYFSVLDLACGYYQIEVAESDQHKTAFVTRYGLFEHRRMPFGLTGAPATFQRAMHLVLKGLTWSVVLAYLDDVVCLGRDVPSHLQNLREVLVRFRQHNLKVKPKKCHLFQTEIKFLGKVVSGDGIAVDPSKTEVVAEWPIPRSIRDVESFLGFVNYHRDHIDQFARVAKCLYELTGPRAKFVWQKEHQEAFEKLKEMLVCAPVLSMPRKEGIFILDCDASDYSIGAELSQVQDEEERTISYGSFALTPAQRRYCTTRKELLSVVRFTRQFRHYLLGRQFTVRTDHNSLTWLMRFKQVEGQLARWIEELSQYDMVILHRAGKKHVNADSLSRIPDGLERCDCYQAGASLETLPCGGCAYCTRAQRQWSRFESDVDDVVPLAIRQISINSGGDGSAVNWAHTYSVSDLRKAQEEDPEMGSVLSWLETGHHPTNDQLWLASPETKHLWLCRDRLLKRNGVWYYQWDDPEPRLCLVVPNDKRKEVIRFNHDVRTAGHLGQTKTVAKVKESFFWYGMARDVVQYVKTCALCSKNKKPRVWPKASLGSYHAGVPLERVHIDILGPMAKSRKGNQYVLMLVDQFTKWMECYALPDQTAVSIAEKVVHEFIARFGCPLQIHSDQGRNMIGTVFQGICDLLQISKTRTTPYRPRSNGQVERYNRLLLQTIRCCLRGNQNTWDEDLPLLASAIRSMVHRQTGYSANMMMLGREVTKPVDLLFGMPAVHEEESSMPEYVASLSERFHRVHRVARENLRSAQARQKRDYDLKLTERSYEGGDLVYQLNSATKIGQSKKLQSIWLGPYLVTEVLSPILYRIKDRKRELVVHHDRLRICEDRFIPMWLRRLRHNLLDLDDTLPDDQEESDEDGGDDAVDLSVLFRQLPVDERPVEEESSDSSDSEESEVEEDIPSANTIVGTTRHGRQVRRPAHLRDYQ